MICRYCGIEITREPSDDIYVKSESEGRFSSNTVTEAWMDGAPGDVVRWLICCPKDLGFARDRQWHEPLPLSDSDVISGLQSIIGALQ